jgi:hypothetical protein
MDNSTTILKKSQRTTKVKVKEQVQRGGVTVKRTRGAVAVAQPVIKINIAKEKEPVKPVRRRAPKKKPSDESGDGKPPGSAPGSAFLYPQVISRTVQQGPSLSDIISLIRAQQAAQPAPTVVTAPEAPTTPVRPPTPIIPSARVTVSQPAQMVSSTTQVEEPVKVETGVSPIMEMAAKPPRMAESETQTERRKRGPRRDEIRERELQNREELLNRMEEEMRLEQARLSQAQNQAIAGPRRNLYEILTPVSETPSEEEVEVPSEGPSQVLEGVLPLPVSEDEARSRALLAEILKLQTTIAKYDSPSNTTKENTRRKNRARLENLRSEYAELQRGISQRAKITQETEPIQEPVVEPTPFRAPERPVEQPVARPEPIAPSFKSSIRRVGQTPRREEDRPMATEGGRMVGQ